MSPPEPDRRILVAEDDPEMRCLVAEALREDGYVVLEVQDGGRLLVTLAHGWVGRGGEKLVDLVVSDVRMPVCTGMQILEQMRAARWAVPVILMTAFADAETLRRARSLDALVFVKPFELDDLRVAVGRLLRRDAP
ncbi:MAG TPA: response regulator [Polyangiaceae bacterium]|nr:response regulator [Polyangiaceae bacterium]